MKVLTQHDEHLQLARDIIIGIPSMRNPCKKVAGPGRSNFYVYRYGTEAICVMVQWCALKRTPLPA